MNKGDLIEEVANVTYSKKEAVAAVDATLAAIKKTLKKVIQSHLWDLEQSVINTIR
jgi:nucleoid DNA-binding protein